MLSKQKQSSPSQLTPFDMFSETFYYQAQQILCLEHFAGNWN